MKLFKKAQALMNESQLLREDITSDRNKVEKEKKILAGKSKSIKKAERVEYILNLNKEQMPSISKK